MHLRPLLPICLASLLAACGPSVGDVPSLQPRPIERLPIDPPGPAVEPTSPASAALSARLASLVAEAETAHRRFGQDHARLQGVLDRGRRAAQGSEAWVQGQQALSELEATRAALREVAAGIEALREDPANHGTGARAAIDTAAARVEGMSAAEAQSLRQAGAAD